MKIIFGKKKSTPWSWKLSLGGICNRILFANRICVDFNLTPYSFFEKWKKKIEKVDNIN